MISQRTICLVADNSGAKKVRVIQPTGRRFKHGAGLGDLVIGSVQTITPGGQIKKKEVVRAVVVRTRFPYQRKDGTAIRFDDNAVVLVGTDRTPRATRIIGPVARELRERDYGKIISMAEEVL